MKSDVVASILLPVYTANPPRLPLYRDWSQPSWDAAGSYLRGLALPFTDPGRCLAGQVTFEADKGEGKPLGYAPIDGKTTEMAPFYQLAEPDFLALADWRPLSPLIWVRELGYTASHGVAASVDRETITVPASWDPHEAEAEVLRLVCHHQAVTRKLTGHLAPEILAAIMCQEFGIDNSLLAPSLALREELRGLTAEKLLKAALLAFEMACALIAETFGEAEAARMLPGAPSPKPEKPNIMNTLFQEVA